ncbi:MAG: hypothetical protein IKO41_09510 [Lachnospiraceae bacterium]|nr:hypothetical protein [Lachnospiraceae bacterium]MBR6152399.1 hypothetical protein [Lachnospiraceae bacterium]
MDGSYSSEFARLHGHRESYFLRWYHEKPMAMTRNRRNELKELHRILNKCIYYMAEHYEQYVPAYMPLSDAEMELLEMQARYPYRAGAYRPDYILAEDGRLLLCEITCRFFAHGVFSSYYAECAADRFMERFPDKERETEFEAMLKYMAEHTTGKGSISVLKSADKTGEIQLYVPFYQQLGKQVEVFEAEEVCAKRGLWEKGCVISALNQADLLSFPKETVMAMLDAGMINDLRTVLIIHDKRFMSLWYEDDFTGKFLTASETAFLRSHAIPTWLYGSCEDRWEDARKNKNGYILKHHRLGKSEKVYGGPITEPAVWESLWEKGDVRDMILQPFIQQRTFPTVWEGQAFDDYICGMMLCVDDRYFESGIFRASSLPVTNVGDDRKVCPIYTDDEEVLRCCDVL